MQNTELMKFVSKTWELPGLVSISALQRGENDHYICHCQNHDYFLRVSPRQSQTSSGVESELAWLEALAPAVPVPIPLRTVNGSLFSTMFHNGREASLVLFEALWGSHLTAPSRGDWMTYGTLLRDLHNASDAVLAKQGSNWQGRQRSIFDPVAAVQSSVERILAAEWVPKDLKADYAAVAGAIEGSLDPPCTGPDIERFIHFDLHLGNLMVTDDAWVLLDFEECCFGPRSVDLGVVRLHARSDGRLEDAWPLICEGYGSTLIANNAATGAALKAMHLAGKIPDRLDHPEIRDNPPGVLRHLLNIVCLELEEATI